MKKHSTQYKNSVFCLLFNNPDKLRNLYNALTGSSYGTDVPVSITTLRNTLSLSLRNDISFTIGGKTVVLIEHQSTINPNMPLRLLLYMAAIYEKMIPRRNLYSRRKLIIPRPEFYLFYNGSSAFPDRTVLKLSSSFEKLCGSSKPSLELEVKAYNINAGHNKTLLKKSRDLGEYARFVAVVQKKKTDLSKDGQEDAFRLAIIECKEHNILKEFLETYGEEVMKSLLNITLEEFYQIRAEEAWEEGREEGLKEGLKEALKESRQEKLESARKMKNAGLSTSQIKTFTGLSPQTIRKL